MPASKTKNVGTGTVIISSPDATATYTATSVTVTPKTHANVTLTAGSGLTYASGTGATGVTGAVWSAPGNYSNVGTVSAKDFLIDGEISLREVLEQRLNMLVPNPELEKEWEQLKELGDAYRKLEADLKEKAKMWQALNKKS